MDNRKPLVGKSCSRIALAVSQAIPPDEFVQKALDWLCDERDFDISTALDYMGLWQRSTDATDLLPTEYLQSVRDELALRVEALNELT